MNKQPWVEGSLEVLELSSEQYFMGVSSDTDVDRNRYFRASLINSDNAAELAVKSFIEYARAARASSNFFENLKWIRENGNLVNPTAFKELEKSIRYHHKQRDTVYHHRYLLVVDRAEALDSIAKVSMLFSLLFQQEFDRSVRMNLRRRLLLAYAGLEKTIADSCVENNVGYTSASTLHELVLEMLKVGLIGDETVQLVQEVLLKQENLIPRAKPLSELQYSYELCDVIDELIVKLRQS